MPQYLVAGYLPDDFDPSQVDEAMGREIHALNKEMIAAGVRRFACGLGSAKSLRTQTDGEVLITDGPYLETKEHIGGFWILECADIDEAVAWARKGRRRHSGTGRGTRDLFQSGTRLATERYGSSELVPPYWSDGTEHSSGIAGACTSLTCSPDD